MKNKNCVGIFVGALFLCLFGIMAFMLYSATNKISLIDAIHMRMAGTVKSHIAAGSDVNAVDEIGFTPLMVAALSGQVDIVQLLLSAGADINAKSVDGNTALMFAIQTEQPDMALFLIKQNGIDLKAREKHGSTALVEAIAYNQINVADALLKKGVDINELGPVSRTALHIAATSLNTKMFKWLIARGASPDAVDLGGDLPLHNAALYAGEIDYTEDENATIALQFLIDSTSDISAANKYGQTPLHIAVINANQWVIKRLVEAGTDLLILDNAGNSPVCYSALKLEGEYEPNRILPESLAIIKFFRAHGLTDESIIDKQGTTLKEFEDDIKDQP